MPDKNKKVQLSDPIVFFKALNIKIRKSKLFAAFKEQLQRDIPIEETTVIKKWLATKQEKLRKKFKDPLYEKAKKIIEKQHPSVKDPEKIKELVDKTYVEFKQTQDSNLKQEDILREHYTQQELYEKGYKELQNIAKANIKQTEEYFPEEIKALKLQQLETLREYEEKLAKQYPEATRRTQEQIEQNMPSGKTVKEQQKQRQLQSQASKFTEQTILQRENEQQAQDIFGKQYEKRTNILFEEARRREERLMRKEQEYINRIQARQRSMMQGVQGRSQTLASNVLAWKQQQNRTRKQGQSLIE